MVLRTILLPGIIIVATSSLVATPLSAQAAGDRVRIESPFLGSKSLVGTVETFGADSLFVLSGDGLTLAVPLAFVTRLEVSAGQRPFGGRTGAIIGALIGIPLGALVAQATYQDCVVTEVNFFFNNCTFASSREETVIGNAILLGGAGALVGLIVGRTVKIDLWEDAPFYRPRVRLAPQRNGRLGLGMSLWF